MYVEIINPYYTSGIRDYAAVPVPTGDAMRLWSDYGDLLAEVFHDESSGRFTITREISPSTLLYSSWELALSEASGIPRDEIKTAGTSESFE